MKYMIMLYASQRDYDAMAGKAGPDSPACLAAADQTTNLPQRRYLLDRANILTMESDSEPVAADLAAAASTTAGQEDAQETAPALIVLPAEDTFGVCDQDGDCH